MKTLTDRETAQAALYGMWAWMVRARLTDEEITARLEQAAKRAATSDQPGEALMREYEALYINGIPSGVEPRGILHG